jgi:hypothetical protein
MMQRTQLVLFVLLTAVLTSGCGTVCNLISDDPAIYGGCEHDRLFAEVLHPQTHPSTAKGAVGMMLFPPFLLTLDLIGDTLTLPIAWLLTVAEHPDEGKPDQTSLPTNPDAAELFTVGAVAQP